MCSSPPPLQPADELPGRLRDEVVVKHEPRPVLPLDPAHVVAAVGGSPFVRDNGKELVVACVAIKILRRVRPPSSHRPPRHLRLLDGVALPVPHRSTEPAARRTG